MSMTLFPKTISYIQVTGSYSSGVWTNTETTASFSGSVQPLSYREIMALDVGRKDIGKVKVYSSISLNISQEGGTTPGDIIIWQGKKWEIISAGNFQNDLIPHYRYIAEFRGPST